MLNEVARLEANWVGTTELANAHHKGEHAKDLGLVTVYSSVVTLLRERYGRYTNTVA
jgi:hypothetical protein